jgi:hypothetical protein
MRGRNNRKGPNPLSRAYESNGPDVKIRGTAQHVAEKYLQLARDAQSSGDPVMAESYLQHSEHYFRIIAAAQTAQQQAQMGYARNGEEVDDVDEDDDFVALPDRFASPFERAPQPNPQFQQPQPAGGQTGYGAPQPQPYFDRPAFVDQNERPVQERQAQDRSPNSGGERHDRQHRNDRRFGQQGDRPSGERQQGQGQGRNRFRDQPRFEPAPVSQEQPRVDFDAVSTALPAFITAPSRPALPSAPIAPQKLSSDGFVEHGGPSASPDFGGHGASEDGENHFHLRPRRRRRPRSETGADGGDAPLPETSSAE